MLRWYIPVYPVSLNFGDPKVWAEMVACARNHVSPEKSGSLNETCFRADFVTKEHHHEAAPRVQHLVESERNKRGNMYMIFGFFVGCPPKQCENKQKLKSSNKIHGFQAKLSLKPDCLTRQTNFHTDVPSSAASGSKAYATSPVQSRALS